MRTSLIVAMLMGLSCARSSPKGGLAVESDAEGIGAVVYVNGRVVGHLREKWQLWITSAPVDTIAFRTEEGAFRSASRRKARVDSTRVSWLDASVPMGRECEIVLLDNKGTRVATRTDLGESTFVHVSLAERHIVVQACLREMPSAPRGLQDDGGYHEEIADTGAKAVAAPK